MECHAAIGKAIGTCPLALSLLEVHNRVGWVGSEWKTRNPFVGNRETPHPYKILPGDWHYCQSLTSADMSVELCQEALKWAGSWGEFDSQ